jgi:hypothetical protein
MYIIIIIWIANKHVSSDWLTLDDGTDCPETVVTAYPIYAT